jgi:hypothetical protein
MMTEKQARKVVAGWRRYVALALVVSLASLALPTGAQAQSRNRSGDLPGIVSGKVVAIMVAVAAGAIVTMFWLKKRSANPPANPSLAPGRVVFGAVQVGEPAEQVVTLSNASDTAVVIRAVSLSGRAFSVDPLSPLPFVLAPDATAQVRVTFHPVSTRMFSERLRVETLVGLVEGASNVVLEGRGI